MAPDELKPTAKSALRFDSMPIKTFLTPEGFLIDTPLVARCGVQVYNDPDGVRREARLPEHVFDPASLESYEGKDIILTHETNKDGLIDSENFRDYTIGNIIKAYRDGDYVRCKIIIKDVDALKNNPDLRELSLSYTPTMLEQSGVLNGEEYDSIQTNIRINNLAVVKTARAGDNARLNLDEEEKNSMEKQAIETQFMQEDKGLVQDAGDGVYAKIEALKAKETYGTEDIPAVVAIMEEIAKGKAETPATDGDPVANDAEVTVETGDDVGEAIKKIVEGLDKVAEKYLAENPAALDSEVVINPEDEPATIKLDGLTVDEIVRARAEVNATGAKIGLDVSAMTPTQAKTAIVEKMNPGIRLDGLDLNTVYKMSAAQIANRKPLEAQYEGVVRMDGDAPPPGQSTYEEAHKKYVDALYNQTPGGEK